MRFIALDTPKPLSKIGLGTWQFGSREWGYGREFEQQAAQIVRRAADIDLADDEYAALVEAAKRFRPVTGLAAMPAMVRARIASPTRK